jgi:hypothetical protein
MMGKMGVYVYAPSFKKGKVSLSIIPLVLFFLWSVEFITKKR